MKNTKLKGYQSEPHSTAVERLCNGKHFSSVVSGCSDVFVTGKFCDVKIVCMVRLMIIENIMFTDSISSIGIFQSL